MPVPVVESKGMKSVEQNKTLKLPNVYYKHDFENIYLLIYRHSTYVFLF